MYPSSESTQTRPSFKTSVHGYIHSLPGIVGLHPGGMLETFHCVTLIPGVKFREAGLQNIIEN